MSVFDREYIIEGKVVDTYGGDYTYRDVYYLKENGRFVFYEEHTGAKASDSEEITDPKEIQYLMTLV